MMLVEKNELTERWPVSVTHFKVIQFEMASLAFNATRDAIRILRVTVEDKANRMKS